MILTSQQIQAVISFQNYQANGLSKSEAADKVGISRSTLARWAVAENAPKPTEEQVEAKTTKKAKKAAAPKRVRKPKAKKEAKPRKSKAIPAEAKIVPAPEPELNTTILNKTIEVIIDQLGVDAGDVSPESHFIDDLGADSLDTVELAMALEDEFDIEIPDEDVEKIKTVKDAVLFIMKAVDELPTNSLAADDTEPDVLVPFQAIVLPQVLTVVRDSTPLQIDKTHKNYDKISAIVANVQNNQIYKKDLQLLYDLIDMVGALSRWSSGKMVVTAQGVTFDGKRIDSELAGVMMRCLEDSDEKGLEKFSRFFEKLEESHSFRVNKNLFNFVTKTGLRIDGDGDIIALKVVRNNYLDKYTGTMKNNPGLTVEMPRSKVDDRDNVTCSHGLHICAPGYVRHFSSSSGGDRLVEVKVDPRDIVSVPTDYNFDKCRCCKYIVLGDVSQAYGRELYNTK